MTQKTRCKQVAKRTCNGSTKEGSGVPFVDFDIVPSSELAAGTHVLAYFRNSGRIGISSGAIERQRLAVLTDAADRGLVVRSEYGREYHETSSLARFSISTRPD